MSNTDLTYLPLKVKQGNNPRLIFLVSRRTSSLQRAKYPTEGRTWEFFLKDDKEDDDPAPIAGVLAPAEDTTVETAVAVSTPAGAFDSAKSMVYHLDAVGSERDTVAWGPISVIDT